MTLKEKVNLAMAWYDSGLEDRAEFQTLMESILAQPPQRSESSGKPSAWQGLTDEEFNELYDRYVPLTCYALLIEKVEAKLKQKNGFAEQKNRNTRETTYINYDSV
jgi:hypothetical protein